MRGMGGTKIQQRKSFIVPAAQVENLDLETDLPDVARSEMEQGFCIWPIALRPTGIETRVRVLNMSCNHTAGC